ncbi:hypothetical protein K2P56_01135 [Patescibacteria group bacterium]|nr:hypothetical protein [Patescibacteria group bacterium]
MDRRELRRRAGFRWPQNATMYSEVRIHFKDGREAMVGVLTGTADVVQLNREHTFTHEEIASIDVIKPHEEIL